MTKVNQKFSSDSFALLILFSKMNSMYYFTIDFLVLLTLSFIHYNLPRIFVQTIFRFCILQFFVVFVAKILKTQYRYFLN